MDPIVNQTAVQKQIAFAQSEHFEAVLAILKDCMGVPKLLGESEYETVINAATLDAQQMVLTKFINRIDFIKQGGLLNTQHNG